MHKQARPLLIFVIALLIYLLFNSNLPITDPVESNYALTAKEMVESGDWLSPRIYGHFWFDKPIMIYWLIAVCYKIFGINEFAARFPSALFSAGSIAWTYWFTHKLYNNKQAALLSSLILATSLEYWLLSRMVITDAVLFFYSSISLSAIYLGLTTKAPKWYWLAYFCAGLAVLTKGPVGLVLPGIILVSYLLVTRQWSLFKKLHLCSGLAIFLLTAAPWYLAMSNLHGDQFINTFLGLHNYLRATVSEHPKDNVFYYYLVLFPVSLLPWSGMSLLAAIKLKRVPHYSYLMTWILVILIFYTCMATKYPTYVFPASFPMAILTGVYLARLQLEHTSKKVWLWLTIPNLIFLTIILLLPRYMPSTTDVPVLFSISGCFILLIFWLQFKGKNKFLPETTAIIMLLCSLLIIKTTLIPLTESRSAKMIMSAVVDPNAIIASYGDYATSAVFYGGYPMPQLVQNDTDRPTGVWSGKYTMPLKTISAFEIDSQQHEFSYILVKAKDTREFENLTIAKKFKAIKSHANMTLYFKVNN